MRWLFILKKFAGEKVALISSFIFLIGINPITSSLILMSDILFVFLFVAALWMLFCPEKFEFWWVVGSGRESLSLYVLRGVVRTSTCFDVGQVLGLLVPVH